MIRVWVRVRIWDRVVKSHVRYPVGPADTDDLAMMAAVVGINANQVGLC